MESRGYRQPDAVCAPWFSCPRRSRRAPFFGRLDRLAVDDSGGRFLGAARGLPVCPMQCVEHPVQLPGVAQAAEKCPHRGPRREILGQVAPLISRAELVENRVHHQALAVRRRRPALLRRGKKRLNRRPFPISQRRRIRGRRRFAAVLRSVPRRRLRGRLAGRLLRFHLVKPEQLHTAAERPLAQRFAGAFSQSRGQQSSIGETFTTGDLQFCLQAMAGRVHMGLGDAHKRCPRAT